MPSACPRFLSAVARVLLLVVAWTATECRTAHADEAPFPGRQSKWNGFTRYDFEVDGKPVLVVAPATSAPGKPWVWHGEFFGHRPAPDIALLKRGFHVAYMRVPNMLGSPKAVAHWNACYSELTGKYGLAKKVALVGLSRGGLYCYNWAIANPDKVACIYGDAPVCDFKSWPGGRGSGKGSTRDWKLVLEQYGFKSDDEALAYEGNPVDNLAPLARHQVPLLHVYGDADEVVPWDENTGLIAERYRKLGGQITLIAKPGVGHHPHGLEDSTPIVEFIARHAAVTIMQDTLARPQRPNIVLILVDDMGYGDPQCFNPESKCVTPNIDRLAAQGMRLTDAHAAGSVCVPSRYGLLTGRYPFRKKLNWREEPCIDQHTPTVASMLRGAGYHTAMVGKWHLGFEPGERNTGARIGGGPVDRGFDSYFGMPASLDIPPYYFIEQGQVLEGPTETIRANSSEGWSPIQGAFWREGKVARNFTHNKVLDQFGSRAATVIGDWFAQPPENSRPQPLFLYVALTAPHTPWLPAVQFRRHGEAGMYGNFVAHVDHVVGQILQAVEDAGQSDETLVLFTSDNGPVWLPGDVERFGHRSVGPLRGMKADAWEGGHRVPLIARWPERIAAGSTSDQLVGFVDVLATLAELTGAEVSNTPQSAEPAGVDSVSFLPALLGEQRPGTMRTDLVVHHSGRAYRDGPWKLIEHLGSGGFSEPRRVKPEPSGPTGQLYRLDRDPGETENLWQQHPEVVTRLRAQLQQIRNRQAPADR